MSFASGVVEGQIRSHNLHLVIIGQKFNGFVGYELVNADDATEAVDSIKWDRFLIAHIGQYSDKDFVECAQF